MEYSNILSCYQDIVEGFTLCELLNKETIYIKHPTQSDITLITSENERFEKEAVSSGIEKQSDQIKFIIRQGWWTNEEELYLNSNLQSIERLEKTKGGLNYNSDKRRVDLQIKSHKKTADELINKRSEYLGLTAESYAANKTTEFSIALLTCDKNKEKRFDKPEDFYDLQEHIVLQYKVAYFKYYEKITTSLIKMVAASGFFQNLLYIADDSVMNFFGNPVVKLTKNQNDLFLFGKIYRNAIKNTSHKIPEEILNNPEKLIEWAEGNDNARALLEQRTQGKSKGEKVGRGATFLFGDKEDLKDMGVTNSAGDLIKKAKDNGGTLGVDHRIHN